MNRLTGRRRASAAGAPVAALAACAALVFGCATAKGGLTALAVGVSALRSPVFLTTPEVNSALSSDEVQALDAVARAAERGDERAAAAARIWPTDEKREALVPRILLPVDRLDRFDGLEDLGSRHTLILVTLSGGGARASVLAARTLAALEQTYNAAVARQATPEIHAPLVDQIDAYSTVSGGSLFAYHLALNHLSSSESDQPGRLGRLVLPELDGDRRNRLQDMARSRGVRRGTRDLGFYTAVGYLAPANLLVPPLITFATDRGYTDLLAFGLGFSRSLSRFFLPWRLRLGDLERRPLFLFNTTSLETGTPFVLTQSILHLPGERTERRSARLDAAPPACCEKPLRHAQTLEEILSSPANFPLAYAAVASAAYPLGIEPLPLRRYAYSGGVGKVYRTRDRVHLVDGGVYDNSGLVTALDLIEYLVHEGPRGGLERIVLLAINADRAHWDADYLTRPTLPGGWSPVGIDSPIRGLGWNAVRLNNYVGQRGIEELVFERLRRLTERAGVSIFYFPVSLLQLAETDRFPVEGGPALHERIRGIGTRYTISGDAEVLIGRAAELLVSADRTAGGARPDLAWRTGPGGRPIARLDEAFAYAVLRARAPQWSDPLQ